MPLLELAARFMRPLLAWIEATPVHVLLVCFILLILLGLACLFVLLHLVAPKPRPVIPSEKTYITSSPSGKPTTARQLPCWYDRWLAERRLQEQKHVRPQEAYPAPDAGSIEPAELRLSVVFPAYNEEDRILPTLEEAVEYLDKHIGRSTTAKGPFSPSSRRHQRGHSSAAKSNAELGGYEILIVNDGSKDKTVEVALDFAHKHDLHDILRVVTLVKNRGKGGGVTHGLRHVRGEYVLFADADGASRFSDVSKLIEGCEEVIDGSFRGVAIGSRAHLVGSEAVVKRSALRNFLMRSFHLVLTILTPPATSRIRDTQCGFKLFSRESLPHIVPYMHAEGWIFDIEMLMLAESAPATPVLGSDGGVIGTSPGIKVAEVPIEWHEVGGSKLNVIQDSIKMAVGLAVLRASWMMGVYRRRLT
ncbi:glycosyl transferase family 2 protein [Metarhizium robertsii]|uniref:dolichyl-phosphate beta-glucosyltransferase n=2 Tax=Metarhizium robertsii TaxID=568076 RepID=E9F2C8_METRA|nr:glycosyltransferase family 2 protein [Metarhizium robertsii ARSEF 23]EFY98217.1 glycosyltransferase family 2 protein [Metarhizium robertsii ARSEF 23]EXV01597.1 glycosyl transferase family 2 protein [Metarhizium robertsii]